MTPYLLTPAEYAKQTGKSAWTVRRELRLGQLAGKRVGGRWKVYANQERHR